MRIAYRITKATDTHSEYVIFAAFPLQQWLHERPSMLRYTYIACSGVPRGEGFGGGVQTPPPEILKAL